MSNTSMTRKLRAAGVASAIFAVGAGIGWQVAGLLFQSEPPVPIVAAIQFEGPHQVFGRGTISKQGHEAVPAPAPQQAVEESRERQSDTASHQLEEERKLADALQWADRYRQRQEAAAWEAVAKHQQQIQKLAQTQGEQALARHGNGSYKLADAGIRLQMGAQIENAAGRSDPVVVRHLRKQNDMASRVAHRARARLHRAAPETVMCPLRWL
jgi:hypothetical protein